LDTALEALGKIQASKIKQLAKLREEVEALRKEQNILLGLTDCTWEERMEMFHKVLNVYSPMIRNGNY
jgi:hypothetical protein